MPEIGFNEELKRLRELRKLKMDMAKSFKKGTQIRKVYEQDARNTEKHIQKLKNNAKSYRR